jgi:hypothetical protein
MARIVLAAVVALLCLTDVSRAGFYTGNNIQIHCTSNMSLVYGYLQAWLIRQVPMQMLLA